MQIDDIIRIIKENGGITFLAKDNENGVLDDRLEVTFPGGLYNGLTYEEVMIISVDCCLCYTSVIYNSNLSRSFGI